MTTARIELPPKLLPVFDGDADVRGAYGGRGSAKTRTFAKMTAVRAYVWSKAGREGIILCGRQFMNSLDDSSLEEVKAAINSEPWLAAHFEIGEKYIRTRDGRVSYKFAGLDRNIDSIKSKARILLCWVDEAEPVTEQAWQILIPTLREEDSELWVTWNPKRKSSATEARFRRTNDLRTKVTDLNWRDNPWFPAILERARQKDLRERPEQYSHIWEGAYAAVLSGAYFAQHLTQAKLDGRIVKALPVDPIIRKRAFFDLGGAGANADAMSIWIAQWVGREIRLIDYIEGVGQVLAFYVSELHRRGHSDAICFLPHDGVNTNNITGKRYQDHLEEADFEVEVISNQGRGAAMMRIEAARRLFPACYFDAEKTEAGRDALGFYHEKRDEDRNVGLGPEHDWSSHGCFAPETKLLTRYGLQRIDSLPDTGEVLTPCGWKRYALPRVTRHSAPLVEVVFTGGYSVRCTPDHLFLTESGWRSAESLTPNTVIRSTLTKSRSISMGVSTGFGRAMRTYREAVRSCIATCGGWLSALSPKDATSITATVTPLTTGWTTLSASQPGNISRNPGLNGIALGAVGSRPTLVIKQPIGTNRMPAGFGISVMPSGRNRGRNGSARTSLASIATRSSQLWFERAATQASSALRRARLRLTGRGAERMNMRAVIKSVRQLSATSDVWDITVPDGHWFSLENGAVVHNSDAFGLMCVAYEEPRPGRQRIPQRDMSWVA